MAILVWFRQDLRLADNPALSFAIQSGEPVIPVYLYAPQAEGLWPPGAASRWWLHQSLTTLKQQLQSIGSNLILVQGDPVETLLALMGATGCTQLAFNRRYEPAAREQEIQVKAALQAAGFAVKHFQAGLLVAPEAIRTRNGGPFQVFTPYWRQVQMLLGEPSPPAPAPKHISAPESWPTSLAIEELNLMPRINWYQGIQESWVPGEVSAQEALSRFTEKIAHHYSTNRDQPYLAGTSRLSPYLHFGEISPRQIRWTLRQADSEWGVNTQNASNTYLKELIWREFAYHLLYHFPNTPEKPLKERFEAFSWHDNPVWLNRWQNGETGYPIVDAGMRQLWATGWMHNRVRMITGSFLVKDLLLPWQAGSRWFWDTLVDADLANNTMGWQWIAGCGADASPFFRIFNPVLQGEKFDPDGEYVRHWIPALKALPKRYIHKPWMAPPTVLQAAGITLGKDYPYPMVDHAVAREQALAAYHSLRNTSI